MCVQGILERLNAGEVVIGDGGFVFALEKRGYVKAGPWTPEATVTHPEAGKTGSTKHTLYPKPHEVQRYTVLTFNVTKSPSVRQLHREFLRAGANVMQTFTFYASDDKLENRGQSLKYTVSTQIQHFEATIAESCRSGKFTVSPILMHALCMKRQILLKKKICKRQEC